MSHAAGQAGGPVPSSQALRTGLPAATPAAGHAEISNRYLQDRVNTATPAELTGMLFDAAVGNMRIAAAMHDEDNKSGAIPLVVKAQEIVLELRCSLNFEAGQLATSLDSLYEYVYRRLLAVNTEGDSSALSECIMLIEPLQLAWRQSVLGQSVPAGSQPDAAAGGTDSPPQPAAGQTGAGAADAARRPWQTF